MEMEYCEDCVLHEINDYMVWCPACVSGERELGCLFQMCTCNENRSTRNFQIWYDSLTDAQKIIIYGREFLEYNNLLPTEYQ
jgi:hypothetical protein